MLTASQALIFDIKAQKLNCEIINKKENEIFSHGTRPRDLS